MTRSFWFAAFMAAVILGLVWDNLQDTVERRLAIVSAVWAVGVVGTIDIFVERKKGGKQ